MAEHSQSTDNQEIDLRHVSRSIKNFFSRINDSFFNGILFLKKHFLIVLILFIAGAGLGYYLDKNQKVYSHEIYVYPNFESVDFLYSEIENLNSKLKESDKDFLEQFGIIGKVGKVEIEPVVDIYRFIEGEENRNYEMFRLLAENNDVTKVVEDNATGRNFRKHLITFTTVGTTTREKTVLPILKYLNSNTYFQNIKKQGIENLQHKIAVTDSTLKQIDVILNDVTRAEGGKGNLMFYNDNTPLNEVIKLKNRLVNEQAENKLAIINAKDTISEGGSVLNNRMTEGLAGKMKYILPLLLIFLFVILHSVRKYYQTQMAKRQINNA